MRVLVELDVDSWSTYSRWSADIVRVATSLPMLPKADSFGRPGIGEDLV